MQEQNEFIKMRQAGDNEFFEMQHLALLSGTFG